MFKCSCGYETDKGNAFSAHYRHSNGEGHKRLGWVDPVSGAVSPTRPRPTKTGTHKAATSAPEKVLTQGTTPAAGITGARPPIVFEMDQQKIVLNWTPLYEAYRYYADLRDGEGLTDGFAETILWCVKDAWKRVRVSTAQQ